MRNNQPPVAAFTYNGSGLSCNFDASGSQDPDGTITGYDWDFGDGATGSGMMRSHTYATAGIYTVVLTVTDDDGASDAADAQVTVTAGQPIHVASIAMSYSRSGSKYKVAANITIHDAGDALISGATVTAGWTLPGGGTVTEAKVTGRNGVAKFSATGRAGTYKICVSSITKAGSTYDAAADHVTCPELPVP